MEIEEENDPEGIVVLITGKFMNSPLTLIYFWIVLSCNFATSKQEDLANPYLI